MKKKKHFTIFKPPVTDFNGVYRVDDNDFIIKREGHDDNNSAESLSFSFYLPPSSPFVSAAVNSIFKIK